MINGELFREKGYYFSLKKVKNVSPGAIIAEHQSFSADTDTQQNI